MVDEANDAGAEAADWFFENSEDVFIVVREGRAVRISPGWSSLLGWSEADTLGREVWDFVHPDDLELVRAAAQEISDDHEVTYQHRVLMPSGDYLGMRVRAKRLADGSAVVVMQDISEELRRVGEAEQIAKANALLNEAAGVHLWRYDPDSDQYEIDPDFSRPFGESDPDTRVSVADVQENMDPADRILVQEAVARGVETGELTVIDFRNRDEDGQWRHLRNAWVGSRQLPSGRFEIIGLTQDLTELMLERDRALAGEDAAMVADRAKMEFLSNISHELRTPMNGLMGALHQARDAAGDDECGRLIDQALASGDALAEFLGDIVEFAEDEKGGGVADLSRVSTTLLIQNAARLHVSQVAKKGLWLRLTNTNDLLLMLDGSKVRAILRILIGNAAKFTSTGGVEIAASLRGEPGEQEVWFEIHDTGPGLSLEDQSRLFTPFSQADSSSTRRFGGAGLGLARARQLAHLMGGDVTCNSAPGQGSTFRLVLPAVTAPVEADVAAQDGEPPLHVLVVDDNLTNQDVACAMLSAMGMTVETAGDGAEALSAAASRAFDLILMDIQMPVMDGVEATRRIRALPGPGSQVPIVALTANVLAAQKTLYASVGMNGCLAKPLSPTALAMELSRIESSDPRSDVAFA